MLLNCVVVLVTKRFPYSLAHKRARICSAFGVPQPLLLIIYLLLTNGSGG